MKNIASLCEFVHEAASHFVQEHAFMGSWNQEGKHGQHRENIHSFSRNSIS